ncbi:hypothetical protein D3870_06195 [Noviherbaspirillum cavernae]|uniref:Uncharacterized protein n=1 Tax=Noviherbaspirillum cavernae TaxID=2320862 RepID=A0A418X604_9BURK|nr:hypothetical protein [Noviherbaspirillum cavernae]RJG07875.1 hypothetical protein D3870_06195 [Noviherbaspirillum cavernae]
MAAVRYTKGEQVAEVDILELEDGKFQGVVLITRNHGSSSKQSQHTVQVVSDTPAEALEEAKALAHRLLAN